MAVVNHHFRYLFLAERRCASRVLSDVLMSQLGSEFVSPHHASYSEVVDSCSTMRLFPEFSSQEYVPFSVVRNPADILVTMHKSNSFQEYMRHMSYSQNCMFFQHVHAADAVLRYENLERDLNDFLRGQGAPEVTIPRKEEYVTGLKNPWPSYYEEKDIDFILSVFPEIARWGYTDIIRQEWEQWQLQMTNGTSSS
jgi:hypothetical protein